MRDWIIENNINVLPWPPQSPDLNPIENVWGYMVKNCIFNINYRPVNKDELWNRVSTAWDNLDNNYIANLIRSMPTRLQSVIAANGAMTKY